jgi:hypothetical protein
MKVVRRKADNVVAYLVADDEMVVIDDRGLHTKSMRALDIKPETHEVIDGVPAPDLFVGGAMAWNGSWTVTNQGAYDDAKAARDQEAREAMIVTRTQLTIVLATFEVGGETVISPAEAEAWVGGTALPSIASDAIAASDLSASEKLGARIKALGAQTIHRSNPLVLMLQAAVPLTDEQTDQIFAAAALIN